MAGFQVILHGRFWVFTEARGLLIALGISIFTSAFTLVAVNVFIHYLRAASSHRVPMGTAITIIAISVLSAVILYISASRQPRVKATPSVQSLNTISPQERTNASDLLTLTLARIQPQTHDAKTLRFLLEQNRDIAMRPGQFLTFEWVIDGKRVPRSYSICSSPTRRSFVEITPKRVEDGYVSQFLNDRAQIGLEVKARGPYGRFYFDGSKHKRIVLIAGGSGITPMIAMLRYMDDLCIPVHATLIYCVRTEHDVFFKEEFAALQERLKTFRYVLVFSRPSSDWRGWEGRLRREVLDHELEKPAESTFFLCGPPAFMELGRTLLKDMAVEPSRILQESFGGAVAQEVVAMSSGPIEISCCRSGVTYRSAAHEKLLESSERNGVLIPSGCRQGICGTCVTKLLSGNVEMDNEEALTDELRSQGFILPCVSRPLTDLTLDV
jgi:ferredoxin-NADP reductase